MAHNQVKRGVIIGKDVANGGCITDGAGSGSIVFYAHWSDESIDERTTISVFEARELMDDANDSQSSFDSTAALLVSWYGFPTLSAAERTSQREACRKGWQEIWEICQ